MHVKYGRICFDNAFTLHVKYGGICFDNAFSLQVKYGRICFDNVSFQYREDREILKNISFVVSSSVIISHLIQIKNLKCLLFFMVIKA